MKIDENRGGLDHVVGQKTDAVRDERTAAAEKAARDERAADRVHVSTTSHLAASAAQAAAEAPDVRAEAVERARARLASGDLGDPGRIADALIDQALDRS